MCLEFLCNWRHHDEDELHRGSPNYSSEYKNTTYYPTKNDPPSKPTDGRKGDTDYNSAYGVRDEPLKFNGPVLKGEHDKHPARDGPLPKLRPEPYNGSESGPKGGNQLPSGVVVNGEVPKAAHTRPHDSVPYGGNNTVLATPVQQPNHRIGADSNGHNHAVDDSSQRNHNMQKEEEDEDEEGVPRVAELKNRWYF